MWGRKKSATKGGGSAFPIGHGEAGRRALNEDDMKLIYAEADLRTSGVTPSVFDIEQMLVALERYYPIEVHTTRRQLKWLLNKAVPTKLGVEWSHPYEK